MVLIIRVSRILWNDIVKSNQRQDWSYILHCAATRDHYSQLEWKAQQATFLTSRSAFCILAKLKALLMRHLTELLVNESDAFEDTRYVLAAYDYTFNWIYNLFFAFCTTSVTGQRYAWLGISVIFGTKGAMIPRSCGRIPQSSLRLRFYTLRVSPMIWFYRVRYTIIFCFIVSFLRNKYF